uniref:Caldesmon 1b n=1 Tax=Cyprinus carpio TaxID=7962 RepID=A0A8C1R576_CYPCA
MSEGQKQTKYTATRRLLLKSKLLKKAISMLAAEKEQNKRERDDALNERVPPLNLSGLSAQELQELSKELHRKIDIVDEACYDLEIKVAKNEKEIQSLTQKIWEMKGTKQRSKLKKVKKSHDSKFDALTECKLSSKSDFKANLKTVKKEDEKKEEQVKKPEEKLVEVKAQIQDEASVKKEDEKPHVPAEETPKKSVRDVEVKAKTPMKEEEKPQLKREVEEKPLTPMKKAEEKPVTPKKEVEKKPKWKKEVEEAKAKVEERVKSKEEVVEEKTKPSFLRDKMIVSTKPQDVADSTAKAKKPEKTLSPTSLRSPDTEKQDPIAKLEAEHKLQELKRRRNETDSEALEKMKQKQQTAEAELEELKKKREERRKILEQEEKQKKQQLAEKKAKEEEERRKMKEDIERRRAEAAEKKKQKEESKEGSKAPFIAPKGASAKIGEKAEFLNKSALKSPVKTSHTPLVCKIGNRLEQYTSAVQTKEVTKSPKSPVDVPVAEGLRSIKSMWEKGNVVNPTLSPASPPAVTKETAGLNICVAGRINSWKTKTPEPKPPEPKPAPAPEKPPAKTEQKPAEVTKPRGPWEAKGSTPAKVFAAKSKFVTNGTRK